MVEIAIFGDDPDENFEVFLSPVAFNSSGFLHSEWKNVYFSILISSFLMMDSGRTWFSITFSDFFCSPQ